MTEPTQNKNWPFEIKAPDLPTCQNCSQMVYNHDSYVLVVKYPEGDKIGARATVYHTKCVCLDYP